MRRAILNGTFGGLLGTLLAVLGFPLTTWQFWAVYGLFLAAVINSLISAESESAP